MAFGAGGETREVARPAVYDRVAEITVDPDERFDELRRRYESDTSLRVDGTVFNGLLGQLQQV